LTENKHNSKLGLRKINGRYLPMKKFRWDKKYLYWGVTAFCVIIASVVFYLLLSNFSKFGSAIGKLTTILSPFIWGLVISYLICPITNIYERHIFRPLLQRIFRNAKSGGQRRLNYAKGLAVLFSMLTLIGLLVAFVWLVAPQLVLSLQSILVNSTDYVNSVYEWIEEFFADYPELSSSLGLSFSSISDVVFGFVESLLPEINNLVTNVTSGVFSVVKGVYNVLIGMVAAIYVLYNRATFAGNMKKIVYCIFSVEAAEKIINGVSFADRVFNGFLSGKILDSAIIGIICYVGCAILKMPYAVLVAVIVGITNVIPFFGPFIGAIPSTLIIFMESPLQALIFVIFVILLQQFDGNFLGPKILGNSVGINGFWIMFSIIVGSGLFGFMGMLLGVPVFVLIYSFFTSIINRKLERSGLPTENDVYKGMTYIDPKSGQVIERDDELIREERRSFRRDKGGKGSAWKNFIEHKSRFRAAVEQREKNEDHTDEK